MQWLTHDWIYTNGEILLLMDPANMCWVPSVYCVSVESLLHIQLELSNNTLYSNDFFLPRKHKLCMIGSPLPIYHCPGCRHFTDEWVGDVQWALDPLPFPSCCYSRTFNSLYLFPPLFPPFLLHVYLNLYYVRCIVLEAVEISSSSCTHRHTHSMFSNT